MAFLPETSGASYPSPRQIESGEAHAGGIDGLWNEHARAMIERTNFLAAQMAGLQNGAGYRGFSAISASQTLTAADMGRCLAFTGTSAATVTLPALSAVPDGSAIEIINTGTANLTVQRAGSDQLDAGTTLSATIVVPPGQSIKLLRVPSLAHWQMLGLTAQAQNASMQASIGAAGWQRLPTGLILQWGSTMAGLSGANIYSGYNVTLPIAFPTAARAAFASVAAPVTNMIMAAAASCSTTQVSVYMVGGGALASGSQRVDWFAIGH